MLSYQSLKYREPSTVAVSNRIVKNPHGTSADMGGESPYQSRKGTAHHGIQATMEADVRVIKGIALRAA